MINYKKQILKIRIIYLIYQKLRIKKKTMKVNIFLKIKFMKIKKQICL